MAERPYDVVLYGASGFVGKQTVQYFARHAAGGSLRWAIAGRNRQKLEAVKAEVGVDADVLVADSQDQEAIDRIVSQTRVILTTAGPFALYGDTLVDACVRFKTHYVDITGEVPWVKTLIDRYHAQAAADGTRIIPCCGFDSVPSDLGSYLMVRYLQQSLGTACADAKAYFQLFGGLNGGTLASAFNLLDSNTFAQLSDPFLLNPSHHHTQTEIDRNRDPLTPSFAPEVNTWVAPFFMGPVNTRIVRRSQALYEEWQEPYGPHFTYQEYFKFNEPLAWLQATGVTAGLGVFMGVFQQAQVRSLLQPLLPKPGQGPSEQTMNTGWFSCELIGTGTNGRKVRGLIRDQGDPGNRATVKFVCESALSLALQEDALPGGQSRGGILTPATGLGNVLVERLRQTGMVLDVWAV
ncbi:MULTISPECIES: saccharopine dehydrogenase NADP-binding domain-containing protein [unclassified Leptolyngbya]|uniref:saccharopine dehydrogenase family protein n=1 Tax=unclassified Leptolyngbya TaxID=2650499 RepID=UPI0016844CE9|nr:MULTISPECIES: saccharopine dehydrogenase NADP-binding domain-containing protein [unclassified Leptolyngbya]MBD1909381.1 saccharopine dehydrogenase NADP-binding domain-containing protein [Leptolyngbya sp. FACHB-8]MBD2158658.1 saccharopine dehydrogenase NADP-binding domain-containing protein [Leptolyngbya sp. FACHB-16]